MEEISGRAAPCHRSVFLQFVSFGDCNGQIMSFLLLSKAAGWVTEGGKATKNGRERHLSKIRQERGRARRRALVRGQVGKGCFEVI